MGINPLLSSGELGTFLAMKIAVFKPLRVFSLLFFPSIGAQALAQNVVLFR